MTRDTADSIGDVVTAATCAAYPWPLSAACLAWYGPDAAAAVVEGAAEVIDLEAVDTLADAAADAASAANRIGGAALVAGVGVAALGLAIAWRIATR